jgi:hypothetical protein
MTSRWASVVEEHLGSKKINDEITAVLDHSSPLTVIPGLPDRRLTILSLDSSCSSIETSEWVMDNSSASTESLERERKDSSIGGSSFNCDVRIWSSNAIISSERDFSIDAPGHLQVNAA